MRALAGRARSPGTGSQLREVVIAILTTGGCAHVPSVTKCNGMTEDMVSTPLPKLILHAENLVTVTAAAPGAGGDVKFGQEPVFPSHLDYV